MFGRDGETRVVFQIVEFLQRPIWLVFGIVLKTCLKPLKGLTRKVDCRPAKLRQPKAHVIYNLIVYFTRGEPPLHPSALMWSNLELHSQVYKINFLKRLRC